ncbi:hypothetical protein ACYT7P_09670, partial [Streptococcus pyogenes]
SRIVVASYAASLARRNAMASREIIAQYGSGAIDPLSGVAMPDRLGLALNPNHRQATSWSVLGAQGGVYASGVSGSLTGRAADVLLIDDPFK